MDDRVRVELGLILIDDPHADVPSLYRNPKGKPRATSIISFRDSIHRSGGHISGSRGNIISGAGRRTSGGLHWMEHVSIPVQWHSIVDGVGSWRYIAREESKVPPSAMWKRGDKASKQGGQLEHRFYIVQFSCGIDRSYSRATRLSISRSQSACLAPSFMPSIVLVASSLYSSRHRLCGWRSNTTSPICSQKSAPQSLSRKEQR